MCTKVVLAVDACMAKYVLVGLNASSYGSLDCIECQLHQPVHRPLRQPVHGPQVFCIYISS